MHSALVTNHAGYFYVPNSSPNDLQDTILIILVLHVFPSSKNSVGPNQLTSQNRIHPQERSQKAEKLRRSKGDYLIKQ